MQHEHYKKYSICLTIVAYQLYPYHTKHFYSAIQLCMFYDKIAGKNIPN